MMTKPQTIPLAPSESNQDGISTDCGYRLSDLFLPAQGADRTTILASAHFKRESWPDTAQGECLLDSFAESGAQCAFLRLPIRTGETLKFNNTGAYQLKTTPAGGWLLLPDKKTDSAYWLPRLPCIRRLDTDGHILAEKPANIVGLSASTNQLELELQAPEKGVLDTVVWRLPSKERDLTDGLKHLFALECQPFFIYGSHSNYGCPADLYAHLIHGHVYDTQFVWPRKWKIADELDAYALYMVLSGMEKSTGKRLYGLLKHQMLFSIITRQREDGGWYHGEWTNRMESHVRLHCGGMHLLATALEERDDPLVREALARATAFVAKLTDDTAIGTWFLHDSLELSTETMRLGPFAWRSSRVLGKSESNMLVLNTHLDTQIAIDRYRRLTGDRQYDGKMESAQRATTKILVSRPAEALYSLLYRLIDLTRRPAEVARKLPLPARILKRLTWKYVIPRMHHIRTRFPRLVMPTGYIDRALTLRGVSQAYQSVNIWDLVRYRRRFTEPDFTDIIQRALDYTQHSHLRRFWVSLKAKGHALGFWADALWHLCLADSNPAYRRWLAEAMIFCEEAGFGMPPASLGANTEAVPVEKRVPCPSLTDPRLRIANLSIGDRLEVLVVNPSAESVPLVWETDISSDMEWFSANGKITKQGITQLPAHGWVWGRGTAVDSKFQLTGN